MIPPPLNVCNKLASRAATYFHVDGTSEQREWDSENIKE